MWSRNCYIQAKMIRDPVKNKLQQFTLCYTVQLVLADFPHIIISSGAYENYYLFPHMISL